MSREENIAVYNNTVAIVKKGGYMSPMGKEVKLPNPKEMADGTKFYGKRVVNDYDAIPRYETEIKIIIEWITLFFLFNSKVLSD